MKTRKIAVLSCFVSFLFSVNVYPQSSNESGLTFIVPVQLNNIHPNITLVRILCSVKDDQFNIRQIRINRSFNV